MEKRAEESLQVYNFFDLSGCSSLVGMVHLTLQFDAKMNF
jgi:hypothetical protein